MKRYLVRNNGGKQLNMRGNEGIDGGVYIIEGRSKLGEFVSVGIAPVLTKANSHISNIHNIQTVLKETNHG